MRAKSPPWKSVSGSSAQPVDAVLELLSMLSKSKAELEAGLKMLRAKIDAGEAETWLAEREALRARIGQTTTVVATKLS